MGVALSLNLARSPEPKGRDGWDPAATECFSKGPRWVLQGFSKGTCRLFHGSFKDPWLVDLGSSKGPCWAVQGFPKAHVGLTGGRPWGQHGWLIFERRTSPVAIALLPPPHGGVGSRGWGGPWPEHMSIARVCWQTSCTVANLVRNLMLIC